MGAKVDLSKSASELDLEPNYEPDYDPALKTDNDYELEPNLDAVNYILSLPAASGSPPLSK